MPFQMKQKVIRIIKTPAGETGAIHSINKIRKSDGAVQLNGDEIIWYSQTGVELDPALGFVRAGISSRIIESE